MHVAERRQARVKEALRRRARARVGRAARGAVDPVGGEPRR